MKKTCEYGLVANGRIVLFKKKDERSKAIKILKGITTYSTYTHKKVNEE